MGLVISGRGSLVTNVGGAPPPPNGRGLIKMAAINYVLLLFLFPLINGSEETSTQDTSEPKTPKLYSIEGSAEVSDNKDPKAWLMDAKVLVDGGRYIGHLKASGDFKIHNIPPGSYLVELAHPNYIFDGVRVDISSKSGKIRARRQNPMKPGSVNSLPYPVRFVTQKQAKFFEKREAWNIMDIAKNPMVTKIIIIINYYNNFRYYF